jgi:hypothetical protein
MLIWSIFCSNQQIVVQINRKVSLINATESTEQFDFLVGGHLCHALVRLLRQWHRSCCLLCQLESLSTQDNALDARSLCSLGITAPQIASLNRSAPTFTSTDSTFHPYQLPSRDLIERIDLTIELLTI